MSTADSTSANKVDTAKTTSFTTVTDASTSPSAPARVKAESAGAETGAAKTGEPSAKEMVQETKEAATARAAELAEKAKAEAQSVGERAKGVAADGAEQAKSYASEQIGRQAETLRTAGREYGEDSYQAAAADYLATNLTQAADVLRQKDMGSLLADVNLFARRNPALFLGGAALLGFGIARLMKASEPTTHRSVEHRDRRFDAPQPGIRDTPYGRQAPRPTTHNGGYPQ